MDIQRVGFAAEAIAKWISERTDIQVSFDPEEDELSPSTSIVNFLVSFLSHRSESSDRQITPVR